MYYSYSAAQWLLVFYLYCMLGWCFESTVVSVGQRRLVNRGFLRGPMLPIYGFGAVILLHATSETNARILASLIDRWTEQGYRFGTLDELFGAEGAAIAQ